jgi:hypothetical protein
MKTSIIKRSGMKDLRAKLRFVATVTLSAFIAIGVATAALANPTVDLKQVIAGSTDQAVIELERKGLRLILNDRLTNVNIDGWSTTPLTDAQTDALLKKFGVRTVWDPSKGTASFTALNGVGRAGVEEGAVYLKLDGKVYKGLTLKGYGGNQGRFGEQPKGSLELVEAIRDMEVSTILAENGVDTYVGVIAVERPDGRANFVRLSRTSIRMDSLIDLKGPKLRTVVDYLTDSLRDEVGKKMSNVEFATWLARSNADVIARKDYIRFSHASLTVDNMGIAELVDLGDLWGSKGGLTFPEVYQSQNGHFRSITKQAIQNLADMDPAVRAIDFDRIYDDAYSGRLAELRAFDNARVNLNQATKAQLVKLGFTAEEAVAVVKFNVSTPEGIIDPMEVLSIKKITRDVRSIVERATTDFMRLADGSQLASYYVRGVGGASGVRAILDETRQFMKQKGFSLSRDASGKIVGDVAKVQSQIEKLALERARQLGFERVVVASELTNFSKFIARQALEVIVRR